MVDFFKLNVIPKSMNEVSFSTVLNVESCELWHGRLGHVNFESIRKMVNLNLTPKAKLDPTFKCEVFVQAKHVRKLFSLINRNSDPLELIHSDV